MDKTYIGYARVSSMEQNEARQLHSFEGYTEKIKKIFIDKLSGKNTDRPQLQAMLSYVREGDVVVVSDFSRLARSTRDMLQIVQELTDKGVGLISLKENVDTDTPQGRFMLTVFAALAELERETILQRQREGIALAKQQGKYKGRKPIPFNEEKFRAECKKWRNGEQTAVATMKKLDMKKNRFYKLVKDFNI
ncbi:recombinase family protein [Ruminococcus sp.]|jgi:DNA invertase Pin-like site-specific DNA recombinase|uniref:recombinase family protein n=1 Tax=Ruminococcus sp. TaxID=41978 RepID=UPI0025EE5E79|nr:recombinase family protein [Ruminococcus sp.]